MFFTHWSCSDASGLMADKPTIIAPLDKGTADRKGLELMPKPKNKSNMATPSSNFA